MLSHFCQCANCWFICCYPLIVNLQWQLNAVASQRNVASRHNMSRVVSQQLVLTSTHATSSKLTICQISKPAKALQQLCQWHETDATSRVSHSLQLFITSLTPHDTRIKSKPSTHSCDRNVTKNTKKQITATETTQKAADRPLCIHQDHVTSRWCLLNDSMPLSCHAQLSHPSCSWACPRHECHRQLWLDQTLHTTLCHSTVMMCTTSNQACVTD